MNRFEYPLLICTLAGSLVFTSSAMAQQKSSVIEGVVLSSETNRPVAQAAITFRREHPKAPPFSTTVVTNEEGKFRATLPAGFYQYRVKKPGFGLRQGGLTATREGPVKLAIPLDKEAFISGRLLDPSGKPLAGVVVSAGRELTSPADAEGRFEIRGVGAGWHEFSISDPIWVTEKQISFSLSAGEKKNLGDLTLRRAGSLVVKLIARGKAGLQPIADAYINLSGPIQQYRKTTASGETTFSRLPPGMYDLTTYDERLEWTNLTVEVKEGERAHREIVTRLKPPEIALSGLGQVFLPNSSVKFHVSGLWVDRVRITVYSVDRSGLVDGSFDLNEPHHVPSMALHAIKHLRVALHKRRYSHRKTNVPDLGTFPLGAYIVEASGMGASATAAFLVTGLGLVAKATPTGTLFFAADLVSGRAVEGVEIAAFSHAATQIAATGAVRAPVLRAATDTTGLAYLRQTSDIARVVGYKEGNFAFLNLWERGIPSPSFLKAYLYTDRPVYRPNQTVYFKGILRKRVGESFALPDVSRVKVSIRGPNDEAVFEQEYPVERRGTFTGEFNLPAEPSLGSYTLTASVEGGESWQATFKVLEYRKPEFEVTVTAPKKFYVVGDSAELTLQARYYYGAPVKDAQVHYRVYSRPVYESSFAFQPESEEDEESGRWYGYSNFLGEGRGKTDENGLWRFTVATQPTEQPLSYSVEVDVTDVSSRHVSSSASFMVTPALISLNVRALAYLVGPNQSVDFSASAKTYEGHPVQAHLRVTIEEEVYSQKTYTVSYKPAETFTVATDHMGRATFRFAFPKPGYWRVTATTTDERGNTAKGQSWVWVWREGYSWEITYRVLDVEFDKKSYRPGDTARLIVKSPAPGASLLFSVEGQDIYSSRVIPVGGSVEVIELPVTNFYAPKVFISTILIHNGQFYSRTKTLRVEGEPNKLEIAIRPDKPIYEPGEKVRLTVSVKGTDARPRAADVSLGVVDEAIYAVSPETVEDIYTFFLGSREHWVTTLHSFPRIYLGGAPKQATAITEAEWRGIKVRKVFKDTAFWIPLLEVDDSGHAAVEFTLPDNLTTWRATAIAHTAENEFGSGREKFIARLDVMARLLPPRFFVQGDELRIPGIVHNMTESTRSVIGQLEAEGLTIAGQNQFSGTVEAGGTLRRDFSVRADEAGAALLRMRATAGDKADALEVELPVLPRGIKRASQSNLVLRETTGETTIEFPADAFSEEASLKIALSPALAPSLNESLKELVDFPYGCVEQTMSRFLSAVYVKQVLGTARFAPDAELLEKLPAVLREGLLRLYDLQREDGSWGWWKRGPDSAYMTAYVLYGLALAQRTGVSVRPDVLERGVQALERLASTSTITELPYVYRTLTLMGRSDPALEQKIEAAWRQLKGSERVLYIQALLNLGQKDRAQRWLDDLRAQVTWEGSAAYLKDDDALSWWYSWRWSGSAVETTSLLLENVVMLDPTDPLAPALAEFLVRKRSGRWWMTTRATATVVKALADYIAVTRELEASYTAKLMVNGREWETVTVDRGKILQGRTELTIPASELRRGRNTLQLVKSSNDGALYLTAVLDYYVPPDLAAAAPGLTIERRLYRIKPRRDGSEWRIEYEPLQPGEKIAVGEEIEVRLTVDNAEEMRFVVIEDRLPAGFEAREAKDDARFAAYSSYWDWYAHVERHDERMAFFLDVLTRGRHEFRYVIYSELEGQALALPASIWPMYVPSLKSESQAWSVTVQRD